jgi:hypothetical protein
LDFQVGINLLNGYKKDSIINAKIELEEDADFGEKTFLAFLDVLKNYSNDVVKKYIKLGAINNRIWNTKNNTKSCPKKSCHFRKNIITKLKQHINTKITSFYIISFNNIFDYLRPIPFYSTGS